MTELNGKEKKTLDAYYRFEEEVYNKGNLDAIDEFVAEDFRHHAPFPTPQGRDGYRQFMARFTQAFPDATSTSEDVVVQGNKIAARYTMRTTHEGDFADVPATGRSAEITGISMYRFVEDKIAEEWAAADMFSFMQQVGAVPTPQ